MNFFLTPGVIVFADSRGPVRKVVMAEEILREYITKKKQIKKRLGEFRAVWKGTDEEIFSELCFCICTPQSNAVHAARSIDGLAKSGDLYKGGFSRVRKGLVAVRFPNNKSRYILEARRLFSSGEKIKIKDRIDTSRAREARLWLVGNVKGLGFKEASHFLRNIGFGRDLAILDVHILRNMKEHGVIAEIPKTLSKKTYLLLEEKLREFSMGKGIPMDELDLLFWSAGTGKIFK